MAKPIPANKLSKRIQINTETVGNQASTDFPGHWPGENHEWDLDHFREVNPIFLLYNRLNIEMLTFPEPSHQFPLLKTPRPLLLSHWHRHQHSKCLPPHPYRRDPYAGYRRRFHIPKHINNPRRSTSAPPWPNSFTWQPRCLELAKMVQEA